MVADQPQGAPWVRLPHKLHLALRNDERRIVVVGARGWIGRTFLELADDALGSALGERVACFGSTEQEITLCSGNRVAQQPLAELGKLDNRPTMLLHLAFLTMDKVGMMAEDDYRNANRAISNQVLEALDPIGADRVFVASSGAAAFADDPAAAAPLRLYGGLKRDDEETFANWAKLRYDDRCAAICRIYSVSGPFINKHATYALADLILRALRGEPLIVSSPRAVFRSYVAVEEVLAAGLAVMLSKSGPAAERFDSGGEAIELGALALRIGALTGAEVAPRQITKEPANSYCGDHPKWLTLLGQHGLEHADLDTQIKVTANWLAALEGGSFSF